MIKRAIRHWEVRLGRWRLGRWCEGAPCRLVGGRHPVSIWRVRRFGTQGPPVGSSEVSDGR